MPTMEERFWAKVEKTETCWLWTASLHQGYGVLWNGSRMEAAHRIAYKLLKGNIPSTLELDHLCRNPQCCNPEHLELITHRQNILRGISPAAKRAKQTHCPQSHPYDLFNTRIKPDGTRSCKKCRH